MLYPKLSVSKHPIERETLEPLSLGSTRALFVLPTPIGLERDSMYAFLKFSCSWHLSL